MTHPMLQRNERVPIPASFIHTHGHMLDTVIVLTGPIGHTHSVAIKTCPPIRGQGQRVRVFLSAGWKEFVKENGFPEGDCVLFRLVGTSCFLVSSKLQQNAVYRTPLSKCEKNADLETSIHPAGDNMRNEGVIVYPYRRELDCLKYPGLDAAISSNSRFPQFISKLTKTQLGDEVHHLCPS